MKRKACKKKDRKCCTKKELKSGKKKCCCVPGIGAGAGTGNREGSRGSEPKYGDDWRSGGREGSRRSEPKSGGDRRGHELDARDIGAALMGGLQASVGGSVGSSVMR